MCLKTYTETKAHRAGSHLITGCTGGCHFDTVRFGQGGRGLPLWWPYGLRLPDLVYILSFLFIMNITEMIGIPLRIVLRCFHDLIFLLCWEIKNSWFLIPVVSNFTYVMLVYLGPWPAIKQIAFCCWASMWSYNNILARCSRAHRDSFCTVCVQVFLHLSFMLLLKWNVPLKHSDAILIFLSQLITSINNVVI